MRRVGFVALLALALLGGVADAAQLGAGSARRRQAEGASTPAPAPSRAPSRPGLTVSKVARLLLPNGLASVPVPRGGGGG